MKKAEKAARIGAILDRLYPLPPIPLAHEDPFTLLVAVVLSAQCTDTRVNEVAPRLFALADTPAAMAKLPVARIESIVRPCGLGPAKAKHIRALSQRIVERHGGRVPETRAELESLPGVGHKTASVVLVQAFGIPAFPVDTHIHRLAARWGLSSGKSVAQTERDLKALYPEAEWGTRHLQIIYFGREHCPARGHDAAGCPVCSWAGGSRHATPARATSQRGAARRGRTARVDAERTRGTGRKARRAARPRARS
jgi:endonuclease-3